jgi:ABC-type bacteriocin/lantibiotic exporter with double-glycine peptidase domain
MRLLVAIVVASLAGCASYTGSARTITPAALDEPGWLRVRGVTYLAQRAEADCGAAAIGMVVGFWKDLPPDTIATALRPAPPNGIKAARLREAALARDLAAFVIAGEVRDLEHELAAGRPVLVGMQKPQRRGTIAHYEVVIAYHRARRLVVTLDPAAGLRQNTLDGFLAEWDAASRVTLIVARRAA